MDLPPFTYLLLIPTVWFSLSWLLSRISGWHRLAQRYPVSHTSESKTAESHTSESETASLRSGRIGPVNYYSCLKFGVNDEGLLISIAPPFRVGHPPLFIPWSHFHHVKDDGMMYSHKAKASIGQPTITRMTLPGWVRYRLPMSLRPVDPRLRDDD